ncbi:MAG: NADPH-dependent FMN reductase [Mucilaginibacter sp.]
MPHKTIFAIPGSLRAGSSNHNILLYLAGLAPSDISFNIYNELHSIPPFDPGIDNDTPPAAVAGLRSNISQADAVIICSPEYAFGVPGQLKNALDWLVSSGTLVDKPVALITASSSGEYAHPSLLRTLGALSANIVEEACLLVPFIRSKMKDGKIVSEELKKDLERALDILRIRIKRI